MKSIILLLLIHFLVFGQEKEITDSTKFLAAVVETDFVYKEPIGYKIDSDRRLNISDLLSVFEVVKENYGEDYYVGFYNNLEKGYAKLENVYFPDENILNYLKEKGTEGSEVRESIAKNADEFWVNYKQEKLLNQAIDFYKTLLDNNYVIFNLDYAYSSIGGQFGLTIQFYNPFKKPIKYIQFTVRPYNRVGDKTHDDLGRDVFRGRIIGPLEPGSDGSAEFDDMFWDDNDIIDRLEITYLNITFMDGTTKEMFKGFEHPDAWEDKEFLEIEFE